jgi:hypothetical protein
MSASKILGIIGLCTGWLIPLSGVTLGIIGLCLKNEKNITLNVLSIVSAVCFWILWTSFILGGL